MESSPLWFFLDGSEHAVAMVETKYKNRIANTYLTEMRKKSCIPLFFEIRETITDEENQTKYQTL